MKKLILLVAIATTMSFAACTNTAKTELPQEVAIENAEAVLEDAVATADSANQAVEEAAEVLVETVD